MAQPSPSPVRFPSGISTDFPVGPLRAYGMPHPFRYQTWADDFQSFASGQVNYTKTVTSTGTVAATAGPGGLILMTTAATSADLCSLQLPIAQFGYVAGKKMFFLVRLQVSSAANAEFNVGLIQTTTTPFTVVDGIYFRKPTGAATGLVLNVDASSVSNSTVVPTTAYTLADATNIDLAFMVNRAGDVEGWVGTDLVAYQPSQDYFANAGPVVRVAGATFPTANLNLTVALKAGTASAKTATIDFVMAAVER